MLTILFIVGRTTLFTPVDINLQEQVVDFHNLYACRGASITLFAADKQLLKYGLNRIIFQQIFSIQWQKIQGMVFLSLN